jgi:hypothetical protein
MRVIRRKYLDVGVDMGEVEWERARLFPVSGIGGADEQERRAASALLAMVQSVREFGRAITFPMGAPAGRLSAYIEVPFTDGDKKATARRSAPGGVRAADLDGARGGQDRPPRADPGPDRGLPGCGPQAQVRCAPDHLQSGRGHAGGAPGPAARAKAQSASGQL